MMEVIERIFVEPKVTITLSKTELDILRASLYRAPWQEVANGASTSEKKINMLYDEILDVIGSL